MGCDYIPQAGLSSLSISFPQAEVSTTIHLAYHALYLISLSSAGRLHARPITSGLPSCPHTSSATLALPNVTPLFCMSAFGGIAQGSVNFDEVSTTSRDRKTEVVTCERITEDNQITTYLGVLARIGACPARGTSSEAVTSDIEYLLRIGSSNLACRGRLLECTGQAARYILDNIQQVSKIREEL